MSSTSSGDQRSREGGKQNLQHSCEAHLLVMGGRAEVHGARHVCGAAVVLSTTVQQQQCVLVYHLTAALLSSVVDDSSIPARSCNAASQCNPLPGLGRSHTENHNVCTE